MGLAAFAIPLDGVPAAAPAAVQRGGETDVLIRVDGLRNVRGSVLVCLSPDPVGFPDCTRDPAARRLRVASSAAGAIRTRAVTGQTYAIAVVHDENGDGRLGTMLGIPREGFGFSRNPPMRMGPPRFRDAQFTVGSTPTTQEVRLRYLL